MTTETKLLLQRALSLHRKYISLYGYPTIEGVLKGDFPLPYKKDDISSLEQSAMGIVGCLSLNDEHLCDKDLIPPPPRWELPTNSLEYKTQYVIIHNVTYDEPNMKLWINRYLYYDNVPSEMIYTEIDGINPIMDYLTLLDINPGAVYKSPFTSGLPTLNLQYFDLLLRSMMVILEMIYMINIIPVNNLRL